MPFIGCDCAVCTSPDPRNQRLRSSVWLRDEQHSILLDCGPDFRQQGLRAGIRHLDAVVLTHEHFDHLFGLDDLRLFIVRSKQPLPIYGDAPTLECVQRVFSYAFDGVDNGSFKPKFHLEPLRDYDQPIRIGSVDLLPVPVEHGVVTVVGLRVGGFAYIPDCKRIPEATFARLTNLDTLVIDGLRRDGHRTHFNRDEALAAVARIAPRQAYLTHLTHDWDHARDEPELPAGVALAYDGLTIPITLPTPAAPASSH